MAAPVSIVIPVLNGEEALSTLLPCLVEGVAAGLVRELIVSDGGSTDATLDLARAAGAEIVTGALGRGGQLRRGCAAARGDWYFVLHVDSLLAPGWTDAVAQFIEREEVRAGYGSLSFRSTDFMARWTAGWANLRSRSFGLPYGDQGLLIPRALYADIGGYADIPLMEDVAIARALRGRLVPLGLVVSTDAARYAADGWLWRGARNLWTLIRYLAGVAPERLAAGYQRK